LCYFYQNLMPYFKPQYCLLDNRDLHHIEYVYEPLLAPMQDIFDTDKKHKGTWHDYERHFSWEGPLQSRYFAKNVKSMNFR